MPGVDEVHVQVRLFTKLRRYEIQEVSFSLPAGSGCIELNALLKGFLFSDESDRTCVTFDFLIEGDFLRSTIHEYVSRTHLSTESVINIEYILKEDSPKLIQSLLHDDWVSSVDISDELILTGSYDNTISLWNTQGKCLTAVEGHTMAVRKVLWNRSGTSHHTGSFISASQDQTVLIWQFNPKNNSSNCTYICKGHARSVDCLAIQPSNAKFASGSWDKTIKIWNAGIELNSTNEDESETKKNCKERKSSKNLRTPEVTLSGHKEPVSCLVWNDDNELISAGWDHCIRLWDVTSSTNKHTLTGNKIILGISYSPYKHLIASGSADKFIRLWDIRASGEVVKDLLSSHNGWISSVEWSPYNENLLVSGSYDCTVKLWDIRSTNAPIFDLGIHGDKVMCISWKQSKFVLSGGADCNLHVYEHSEKLAVDAV